MARKDFSVSVVACAQALAVPGDVVSALRRPFWAHSQMTASIPIAHAGHWITNLALFAGPVLVPLIALLVHSVYVRRTRPAGDDPSPSRGHR